ncbi:MAG: hypothetical protein ACOX1T_06815 [Saccharofermentanales bacterium]
MTVTKDYDNLRCAQYESWNESDFLLRMVCIALAALWPQVKPFEEACMVHGIDC